MKALEVARVPCFQVSGQVMESLSSTVTPQGIIAVVPFPVLNPPSRGWLTLVLDGIGNPDNLGAILRTAAAAGVDHVITTFGSVDPYNPKAVRAAMGAHFRVPLSVSLRWPQIAPFLKDRAVILADVSGDKPYFDVDWTRPSALIIGSEAHGPGDEARKRAHESVFIPMPGGMESLNAAVAAGIIIFEAVRQRTLKTR